MVCRFIFCTSYTVVLFLLSSVQCLGSLSASHRYQLPWYDLHSWLDLTVTLIWSTQLTGLEGHLNMTCTVDQAWGSPIYDQHSWLGVKVTLIWPRLTWLKGHPDMTYTVDWAWRSPRYDPQLTGLEAHLIHFASFTGYYDHPEMSCMVELWSQPDMIYTVDWASRSPWYVLHGWLDIKVTQICPAWLTER